MKFFSASVLLDINSISTSLDDVNKLGLVNMVCCTTSLVASVKYFLKLWSSSSLDQFSKAFRA